MELLQLIQAAKLGSAKRITAVMPLFPYARQDRKAKPREPITARLVADMLQLAGADRVLTMDLHAGQIQGFFSIPVDHMTALPLFSRHFRDLGLYGDGVVSVSPDAGRAKQAVRFAEMLELRLRDHEQVAPGARRRRGHRDRRPRPRQDRDPRRRRDHDRRHDARQRARARGAGRERGLALRDARRSSAATPSSASPTSRIKGIVVTDTVPIEPLKRPEKLTVLPVSGLLAETIMNVFADDSVSAIFGGENQLFIRRGRSGMGLVDPRRWWRLPDWLWGRIRAAVAGPSGVSSVGCHRPACARPGHDGRGNYSGVADGDAVERAGCVRELLARVRRTGTFRNGSRQECWPEIFRSGAARV